MTLGSLARLVPSLMVLQLLSIRCISSASRAARNRVSSPRISTSLRRSVAPETTEIADLATPSASASNATTAALALPFSGGAPTATFTAVPPSASGTRPSIRLRLAFGWTFSRNRIPPGTALTGLALRSSHRAIADLDQQPLQEAEQQNEDDRRKINATKVGQDAPDRPQGRLGQLVGHVRNHVDEAVAGV